jgi:hypothetical protein
MLWMLDVVWNCPSHFCCCRQSASARLLSCAAHSPFLEQLRLDDSACPVYLWPYLACVCAVPCMCLCSTLHASVQCLPCICAVPCMRLCSAFHAYAQYLACICAVPSMCLRSTAVPSTRLRSTLHAPVWCPACVCAVPCMRLCSALHASVQCLACVCAVPCMCLCSALHSSTQHLACACAVTGVKLALFEQLVLVAVEFNACTWCSTCSAKHASLCTTDSLHRFAVPVQYMYVGVSS